MGQYTNKDGVNVKTFEVMVDGFDFIGGKSENGEHEKAETPTENFDLDLEIDDLPF